MKSKQELLQAILDNAVDHKKIFGTSFCVKYRGESWCGSSGDLTREQQYFIASTTKLFVTAVIMHYRSKGMLSLDDKLSKFLGDDVVASLNVYKGKDYSHNITISHLLAHTSGIPDYFQGKNGVGSSLEKELTQGLDRAWGFDEAIANSKALNATFAPETRGKAHYADTNFQLLGRIIENISGKKIDRVFEELIIEPLGLKNTYLYRDEHDGRPKTLYYKSSILHIPKAMASFGADGGIVSTSTEMMIFLEAFFGGAFFPKGYIDEMCIWNRIFFPMQSGVGIHRFKLRWFFDPLGAIPELIGHSGLSGALAYYSPAKDLFVTGTVNQVAFPATSFRLMIKLIHQVFKDGRK